MATSVTCPSCGGLCSEYVRCCNCNYNMVCNETTSYCSRRCKICAKKAGGNIALNIQDGSHYSTIFLSKTIEVILNFPKSKSPTSYHLHIDKLKKSSEYFSCLFQFAGKEVTDNRITLSEPTDDPEAFKYFVQFLYCNDYLIPDSYEPYACLLHAMVYVLAERLLAPHLKSLAMTKLTNYLKDGKKDPSDKIIIKMVAAAYSGTYSDSFSGKAVEKKVEKKVESKKGTDKPTTDSGSSVGAETLESLDLDDDSDSSSEIKPIDPLRTLVSRYAASKLDRLRKQPKFRGLLKEFPEFTEDMMLEANNGKFVG